jgi:ABC-type nitrate/sulfonate/bicarbonate transport system substrate-binding protein
MRDDVFFHAGPSRGQFVSGGTALLGALAAGTGVAGAQATPLRLNIFGGLDAWPVYVMREKGLLKGYDLSVKATTGSVPQVQAMMAGDADIALTAMDNVIAYDEGQGDPAVPGPFDFAAFLGVGPGVLRLLVTKDITSYAQLRGKTFAVDAVGTGFTFVLRRMLEKNGIMPGEYTLVPLGSTQKRFDGMVAGQAVGGVVGAPFDVLGQQKYGFHVLGVALETLGHYQATVLMARRSWMTTHRPAIAAIVKAYRDATTWLYDPANRTEAVAILGKNTDLPPELLAQIAPGVLGSAESYSRTGAFDVAGVNTVVELRSAYITPKKTFGDTTKYIDLSYL